MKIDRRLIEQSAIFLSVLRWIVLATIIGAIVGVSTTAFLKILTWSTGLSALSPYYFLLVPGAFFLSSLMIEYLAPEAEGHGTEKVIEAVHQRSGKIKAAVVPVKLVATVVTLAAGGSAGKEGPCAQIGGGLASIVADLLKFDDRDRKKIVICGISAGFASVFGTPIAGAIFGVEVLFVGSVLYDVLLPSFIAGVTSYQISAAMGITYFNHPVSFVPVFSESFFVKVLIAGIFFGLCSFLFIETLAVAEKASHRLHLWKPLKGLVGGAALVVLSLAVSKQYLGLGLGGIQNSLEGYDIVWYAFVMKMVFTSITLNFGGSGGIVTPIFFIGATSGTLFAKILGLDPSTFAAIGLVSVLAGAANTPIAASIMAMELFGPQLAAYAAVACVVSFLMTGHRSVYPSQILAVGKSASVRVEIGKQIDQITADFDPGKKGMVGTIFKLASKVAKILEWENNPPSER